ncbi:MAG: UbiD family decarboxylase [Dehalococcoidia bacterium]
MNRVEALKDQRTTLDWLRAENPDDVKILTPEIDPEIEVSALNKAFDDGPTFVCENIKGYPNARYVVNLWGQAQRVAKLCGVDDIKDVKHKIIEAAKNPTPPVVVKEGPCQELFIPKEEVDPFKLFPMIKHTPIDGGRIFGSGIHFIGGKYADGGSQLALYRMSFRGKDYGSINMVPGGHGDLICERFPNEKIPCTVNICPPPMVELMGWGSLAPMAFPSIDEIGMAGTMQGSPVELVKAKTVDAYAVANSEWVIEGYIVPGERVWETEEAEKAGKQGVAHLHPEWARYMGRAYRTPRKFEITAVTRRKDKPLYFVPFFGSLWGDSPFIEATFMHLCDIIAPGFVTDVSHFLGLTAWSGIVLQCKKKRRSDEGMQRNMLAACLGAVRGLRIAMIVDEDINIRQPEDLFFAMTTRVNPVADILKGVGGRGQSYQPSERAAAGAGAGSVTPVSIFEGGIGIDATVPLNSWEHFQRGRYMVDEVDFTKWLSQEEMDKIRAGQTEYYRWLGEVGYA